MRGAVFVVLACLCTSLAWAASPAPAAPVEGAGLRSIAGWLKRHGVEGYVGADVADAMGIARRADQDLVDAVQRGFREEDVLRMAQLINADTLLFMVQGRGEVYFYLSTLRGGLRKALVSIPGQEAVAPLDAAEAENNFRREVHYWEDKAAR